MKFDDIITDDYGTWTELCEEHSVQAEKEGLGNSSDNSLDMICGCEGCNKIANHYFDFNNQKNK